MKRILALVVTVACVGLFTTAQAQLGSSWFNKPAIAEVINPEVGKGGQYQTTQGDKTNAVPELT